ncbi:S-layer homology domain-containing protein [Paenibacillus sp. FSL H8-0537]|uniref:S-layer homology domain-containing protein n=1 Tax=Paenibacillus sp. FSL H8-0537 TaxID=2921399 RepID=UPI00310102D4
MQGREAINRILSIRILKRALAIFLTLVTVLFNFQGHIVQAASPSTLSLSVTGTHTFDPRNVGYGFYTDSLPLILTKVGTEAITNLGISYSGSAFMAGTLPADTLGAGVNSAVLQIRPKTGLSAGVHTETVTLTADNGISESFQVSFTVNSVPSTLSLSVTGTHTFDPRNVGYGFYTDSLPLILTKVGTEPITNLGISYSGSAFMAGTLPADTLGAGVNSAVLQIRPKTGLSAGVHTETVTFTADNGISESFQVSFTVNSVPSTLSLSVTGTHTFDPRNVGYGFYTDSLPLILTKVGTEPITNLGISYSGSAFMAGTLPADTLGAGVNSAVLQIRPKTGLSAGIYTETVTLTADNGISESFQVSFTVNAVQSSNNNGQTSSSTMPEISDTSIDVLINGKVENLGKAIRTKIDNQTVTTVILDQAKYEEKIADEGKGAVVTIQVTDNADKIKVDLNGQMVKHMLDNLVILALHTDKATYTLPVDQIDLDFISDQIGSSVNLRDITFQVEVSLPTADMIKLVENAAKNGKFKIVTPTINFTVKAVYGNVVVDLSLFDNYVERTIAIPESVDPNNITTGVVIEADGTVRHVPTQIIQIEDKYHAKISSLTNSMYTVIWNPMIFKDVEKHWAKDTVNDMASRMVITGVDIDNFKPDQNITRAEFTEFIVRGLGLKLENGAARFTDVKDSEWYSSAINAAYEYQLISGYEDGTFRPNDRITREQAMSIIVKAMTITGLEEKLSSQPVGEWISSFKDAAGVSDWARESIADAVQAGIIIGKNNALLAPKAYITRAEAAVMIQRLLKKSELI